MDDPEDDSTWVKEYVDKGCTICYYRVEDNGEKDLRRTVNCYQFYPSGHEFNVRIWPRCFDEVDILYEPIQTTSYLPPPFLDEDDLNFLSQDK